jgi:hypothetical protein
MIFPGQLREWYGDWDLKLFIVLNISSYGTDGKLQVVKIIGIDDYGVGTDVAAISMDYTVTNSRGLH